MQAARQQYTLQPAAALVKPEVLTPMVTHDFSPKPPSRPPLASLSWSFPHFFSHRPYGQFHSLPKVTHHCSSNLPHWSDLFVQWLLFTFLLGAIFCFHHLVPLRPILAHPPMLHPHLYTRWCWVNADNKHKDDINTLLCSDP